MSEQSSGATEDPPPESGEDQATDLTSSRARNESEFSNSAVSTTDGSVIPFEDLVAPKPLPSAPPLGARWLALGSTLLAGLLGGLVGYGIGDLIGRTSVWAATGGAIGAITAAGGVGIIANLTLRAMNEWKAVNHPEAKK